MIKKRIHGKLPDSSSVNPLFCCDLSLLIRCCSMQAAGNSGQCGFRVVAAIAAIFAVTPPPGSGRECSRGYGKAFPLSPGRLFHLKYCR